MNTKVIALSLLVAVALFVTIMTIVPYETLSALLTAVYAFTTLLLYFHTTENNRKTHEQYRQSLNPLLSFHLLKDDYYLVLKITNTGKMPATKITINVKTLNLGKTEKRLWFKHLFNAPFELYPNESVQSIIIPYTMDLQPHEGEGSLLTLSMEVSYKNENTNEIVEYSRSIAFNH
jgi:hypothetical protein